MDREVDVYIDSALEELLWKKIKSLADKNNIAAIVFQDYDKGVITPGLIEKIIKLGNKLNIPTLVDPKKRNFAQLPECNLIQTQFQGTL